MENLRSALMTQCITTSQVEQGYFNPPLPVKFHRWADGTVYENDNVFQITYGIVEDETGQVYKAYPKSLKFVK